VFAAGSLTQASCVANDINVKWAAVRTFVLAYLALRSKNVIVLESNVTFSLLTGPCRCFAITISSSPVGPTKVVGRSVDQQDGVRVVLKRSRFLHAEFVGPLVWIPVLLPVQLVHGQDRDPCVFGERPDLARNLGNPFALIRGNCGKRTLRSGTGVPFTYAVNGSTLDIRQLRGRAACKRLTTRTLESEAFVLPDEKKEPRRDRDLGEQNGGL
jgi:hypothetical protein